MEQNWNATLSHISYHLKCDAEPSAAQILTAVNVYHFIIYNN